MLSKSKIALFPIIFVLLLHFQIFFLTPFSLIGTVMNPFFALWGIGFLLIFPKKFDKNFKRWIYGFLILAIISIIVANHNLNQEIFSGIIANLSLIELGSLVFIYHLIHRYHVRASTIIKILKYSAWALFIIYLILFILQIEFTFISPFTGSKVDMDVAKLKKFLINFASVIYLGYFFTRGNSKFLILSLLLFSANMFGDFQRFVFFTYIVTIISGIFIFKNKNVYLKFLPYSLILIFISLFIFSYSEYGSLIQEKFSAAFTILEFNPQGSSDGSVNIRVLESTYALQEFLKYPIFGIGNIRASFLSEVVGGRYFYINDIGLIGILYVFGLIGLLAYLLQLRLSVKMKSFNEISAGLKLNLVFILLYTVLTGFSVLDPGVFFIILLLYLFTEKEQKFESQKLQVKKLENKQITV